MVIVFIIDTLFRNIKMMIHKKLYTCPKLIKKMKGNFQRKWPEDFPDKKETHMMDIMIEEL